MICIPPKLKLFWLRICSTYSRQPRPLRIYAAVYITTTSISLLLFIIIKITVCFLSLFTHMRSISHHLHLIFFSQHVKQSTIPHPLHRLLSHVIRRPFLCHSCFSQKRNPSPKSSLTVPHLFSHLIRAIPPPKSKPLPPPGKSHFQLSFKLIGPDPFLFPSPPIQPTTPKLHHDHRSVTQQMPGLA